MGVLVRKKALERFWGFVDERQRIWLRRFVKKEKPPWTKDATLNEFQFTNVYRELDRGTLFLTEKILPRYTKDEDKLFAIMIYRLFNHIPTWIHIEDYLSVPPLLGKWKWKEMAKELKRWRSDGNQVFTSAFTVTGQRFGGSPDKIDNICWLIDYLQEWLMHPHWQDIWKAKDMETAFRRVHNLLGFGPFLAYEIVIDINYVHRRWGEDRFVNPGPGAKRGINAMYPRLHTRDEYVWAIKHLQYMQSLHLNPAFPYTDDVPKLLSLRNIEHSLCEFQKYEKRRKGIRTGRARVFHPNKEPLPGGKKGKK